MGKRVVDDTSLARIANRLRVYTHDTQKMTFPEGFVSEMDRIYTAGVESGYGDGHIAGWSDGHADGYAEGKQYGYADGFTAGESAGMEAGAQSEYDRFWDAYQQNGSRTDYNNAFGGIGWTPDAFRPKYDIKPTTGYMMFRYFPVACDLVELMNELGVELDFSACTNTDYLFNVAKFTRVGVVDLRASASGYTLNTTFAQCTGLVTIDKIILTSGRNGQWLNTFNNCTSLEDVAFEGLITHSGLNLQWSTRLSRASIQSIINALSATTSGLSVTLSQAAVDSAFETSEGAADGGTSEAWAALAATKSNWTINLV